MGVPRLVDDGFDGFNDTEAGGDRGTRQGPILGTALKFSAAGKWEVADDGKVIASDMPLIVVDARKAVVKRNNRRCVELRIIPLASRFPTSTG